ncbi:MAG: flagellar type III secretion system pore protein FliP [Rhizomicrobium sp.]
MMRAAILALVAAVLILSPSAALARPIPPHVPPPAAVAAGPVANLSLNDETKTSDVVRIALILTLMALLPAILVCTTSFVRIVVVLAMIRHAFGMPETPPNMVLISLAIFLTAFSMLPTFSAIDRQAVEPFLDGRVTVAQAIDSGSGPARDFMLRQVRDRDIQTMYDLSRKPLPARAADVELMQLVPAFMLNELRVAFRIGFVVLLPFLLIDIVVSSVLLALGMLMVPPATLSLPIKVLMFVLIDGWSLVLHGVLGSFR